MSLNNDCAKYQESLSAYIDNEDVDKAGVESHLSECHHCSDVLQKLTDAKNVLVNLPPSISQRDFTSELEQRIKANGGNVIAGKFSKTALAAIFIALTGIIGFYALSNSEHNKVEKNIASIPENKAELEQKIQRENNKIELQPIAKVATSKDESNKQKPVQKEKEITVQVASSKKESPDQSQNQTLIQTAMQVQNKPEEPVNIALNTSDLSSENGLFDDMGFGCDEDGLYAIKL